MPGVNAVRAASSFLNDHIGALIVAGIMALVAQTVYGYAQFRVLEGRWINQANVNAQFIEAQSNSIKMGKQLERLTATLNERDRQEALRAKH